MLESSNPNTPEEMGNGVDSVPQVQAAKPDRNESTRAIELLHGKHDRIELRVIHHVTANGGKPRSDVGIFDRGYVQELIDHAVTHNKTGTVCVNLNPISPEYVCRHVNELGRAYKGDALGDTAVAALEYLLVDCDPYRPSQTSATDEQVTAARETAAQVNRYLDSLGWPAPVECASGNGAHLLYRVDLPNDEPSRALIKGVLEALSKRFDTDKVKIDRSVGKPGQIVKLYGTVANKGANTPQTPHRLSRIVSVPEPWDVVSADLLRKVLPTPAPTYIGGLGAKPAHLPATTGLKLASLASAQFDLEGFLKQLDIPYTYKKKDNGTESHVLKHCPFNPDHNKGEAGISRAPDGKLGFHCFHNSCSDKDWHALRALVEQKPVAAQTVDGTDATVWQDSTPQKLPSALRPVPTFPVSALPDAFAPAALDLTERLQCPIEYLAVSMLSAAGAVVGNKVGIFPHANDQTWEVYPGLWGGIVGDPGSKKTPAIQAAHRPLGHIEDLARQNHAAAMHAHQLAVSKHEAALAAWTKSNSGPKPTAPEPPKKPRLVVHDTTYQALGVILAANPSGVLAIGDELSGLLQSLETPGQEAARGFFLSGWSGTQGYSFDRVTRGSIDLPRYCLSVFGGFQPDRIKTYVRATQRGQSTNDGLLQRFQLLVWPDPLPNVTLVDRKPDQAAQTAYTQAILRLRNLSRAELPQAIALPNKSLLLHFDAEAQEVFNGWFLKNESLLSGGKIDHARQSHFAKYRSMVPALALLFHLVDDHRGQVCYQCIKRAIELAGILKKHANRIYASVSGHDHEATRTLASHLLKGDLPDGFTRRTVELKGWMGLSTTDKAQVALDALCEFGWLLGQEVRGLGRPTVRYYLNPKVSAGLL